MISSFSAPTEIGLIRVAFHVGAKTDSQLFNFIAIMDTRVYTSQYWIRTHQLLQQGEYKDDIHMGDTVYTARTPTTEGPE